MALVSCLYLQQNQSYSQKCVFDLFGDLDLVLDPILTKNIRVLSISFVYMYVKYLFDPMETVTSRALTDKQTNRQTDKQTDRQTYKHFNQHTSENVSFRK